MNLKHTPALDGVRCIAVLLVLFDHWSKYAFGFPMSYLGVCLFFVLSGFLISGILLEAKEKNENQIEKWTTSLKKFYFRRTLRIFPIYYLTLFIAYFYSVKPVQEYPIWHITYTTNIYIALKKTWLGVTDHFWSLAVEEQFYMFFPILLLFIPKRYLIFLFFFFITISIGLRFFLFLQQESWMISYVLTPTCLDAFGLGGILAYVYRYKFNFFQQLDSKVVLFSSFVFYIIVVYFSDNHNFIMDVFLRFAESTLSFFFIAGAVGGFSGIPKKILTNPLSLYIGKISYGLYIYHNFVYNAYHSSEQHPVVKLLSYWKLLGDDSLSIGLRLIILSAITISIATISWYCIEKPINALKAKSENFQ